MLLLESAVNCSAVYAAPLLGRLLSDESLGVVMRGMTIAAQNLKIGYAFISTPPLIRPMVNVSSVGLAPITSAAVKRQRLLALLRPHWRAKIFTMEDLVMSQLVHLSPPAV